MRRPTQFPLLLVLGVVVFGAAACGGGGGDTIATTQTVSGEQVTLTGVATTLTFDNQTFGVLENNRVRLGAVKPATAVAGSVRFPITGGTIDDASLAGTIRHAGGIAFSHGAKTVRLTGLVIDTRTGQLSAQAAGGRIAVLDLGLDKALREDAGGEIVLRRIRTTLTAQAANALNTALGTAVLEAGLIIGEAEIRAGGS